MEFCGIGWPKQTDPSLGLFRKTKDQFSLAENLKAIFARHGIPEVLMDLNIPPGTSQYLQSSSPHYSQSNDQAGGIDHV